MTQDAQTPARESLDFDVVIVGGGPAGLTCAIRIKQRAAQAGRDVSVCVLEKGSTIGAHILSGAVIDPIALTELFPDWQHRGAPLTTPVTTDAFVFLTEKRAFKLPTPPPMNTTGHYVASLGALTQWLGDQAESLGVDVFAGFAAQEVLYDHNERVIGVATGDLGRDKDDRPGTNFTPGIDIKAPTTVFAEGCRGALSERVMDRFHLRAKVQPQTYGLGLKEIWEVAPSVHRPGHVLHTVGWPLCSNTYGGAFVYHLENNLVAVGLVVGLDYRNPYLSPFDEMQRFKTHPKIAPLFVGAKRIAFGARALNEGGFQSIPTLTFPGGALIGAAAGFMNVPRAKGSHTAMKSALVCADAIVESLPAGKNLEAYPEHLKASWVWPELYRARNIRPAFRLGLWAGLAYAALDTYILRGCAPWTFGHTADHTHLDRAAKPRALSYPKPDHVLTFDRAASVFLSNTQHTENQPCHLKLKDQDVPIKTNLVLFDGPEARYCPTGVYEFITDPETGPRLHINAENCIHCKTCDIKDPTQNILWVPPEGGSGPNYTNM